MLKPESMQGENFTVVDVGALSRLERYAFKHPALPRETEGKLFLRDLLGLTGSEISLNKMGPATTMLFHHKHRLNEEVYVFLRGEGEFQIDGKTFLVREGSVVRVAPEGERCWRNTSASEDLIYLVFQARARTFEGHSVQDGVGVPKKVSWAGKEAV